MAFCTVINCMDGRVQEPVIAFLKKRFGVEYVDSVTEPGPNRILAESKDPVVVNSIINRVEISVHQHGSVGIAVVGHEDCAGNPSSEEAQIAQTCAAAEWVRTHYPDVPVIGLWVDGSWAVRTL